MPNLKMHWSCIVLQTNYYKALFNSLIKKNNLRKKKNSSAYADSVLRGTVHKIPLACQYLHPTQ